MSQDASQPAFAIEGISGGYGRTQILRDVSVQVAPHSIVGLLGPNGAGKTTLLRVASGLLRPKAGTVRLFGADVTHASPTARAKAGLCLIPEGRGIFPSLTVRENLTLQTPPWATDTSVDRALDEFPMLRDRLKEVAGCLSGGQQQILVLARIYLAEPKVVLLDEVSMGLAPLVVDQIFEHLMKLAKAGMALVMVEQYVNRVLEMASQVYMMDRGSIVFSGQAEELDERKVMASYLGADLVS